MTNDPKPWPDIATVSIVPLRLEIERLRNKVGDLQRTNQILRNQIHSASMDMESGIRRLRGRREVGS